MHKFDSRRGNPARLQAVMASLSNHVVRFRIRRSCDMGILNRPVPGDPTMTGADKAITNAAGPRAGVNSAVTNVDEGLASADRPLANVDGRFTNIDRRLASADKAVANVDGRLANADGAVTNGDVPTASSDRIAANGDVPVESADTEGWAAANGDGAGANVNGRKFTTADKPCSHTYSVVSTLVPAVMGFDGRHANSALGYSNGSGNK